MTNQEAFSKIIRHLRDQGKPATLNNACKYRAMGLKCAVGCLIPDDQYVEELEEQPVSDIACDVPALRGLDLDLLGQMQEIHDNLPVDQWESWWRRTAEDHKLEMPKGIPLG